jgi:8-oxo-dGTP pyrophosphatase MutT (NUDIX family)
MMSAIDTGCLSNKERFLTLIVERLGKFPIDFTEKMRFVQSTSKPEESHLAAGVLLLLHFRSNNKSPMDNDGEFFFQLIKRSSRVTQPGDLSCPGGLLHNYLDPLLRFFITSGLVPVLQGRSLKYIHMRGTDTSRMITLFLTNAIREAWEETGLRPWNILFQGPLPTYSLLLFKRTIFPLVCFVRKEWHFYPNPEVESIVEIPLKTFFNERNYGLYNVETSDQSKTNRGVPKEFPCLIVHDNQGNEEILWGATFYIIMNFLNIVLGFEMPDYHAKRIIRRTLGPEYITGYQE